MRLRALNHKVQYPAPSLCRIPSALLANGNTRQASDKASTTRQESRPRAWLSLSLVTALIFLARKVLIQAHTRPPHRLQCQCQCQCQCLQDPSSSIGSPESPEASLQVPKWLFFPPQDLSQLPSFKSTPIHGESTCLQFSHSPERYADIAMENSMRAHF
jgi:hypothetical protein